MLRYFSGMISSRRNAPGMRWNRAEAKLREKRIDMINSTVCTYKMRYSDDRILWQSDVVITHFNMARKREHRTLFWFSSSNVILYNIGCIIQLTKHWMHWYKTMYVSPFCGHRSLIVTVLTFNYWSNTTVYNVRILWQINSWDTCHSLKLFK